MLSRVIRPRSRLFVSIFTGLLAASVLLPSAAFASEGCTPGYWKQPQHFSDWPANVGTQSTLLSQVTAAGGTVAFVNNPLSNLSLLAILQTGGGGLEALGRHTVAALLNAGSGAVDYSPSRAMIINWFNEAYNSGTVEATKDRLEYENESGCPL